MIIGNVCLQWIGIFQDSWTLRTLNGFHVGMLREYVSLHVVVGNALLANGTHTVDKPALWSFWSRYACEIGARDSRGARLNWGGVPRYNVRPTGGQNPLLRIHLNVIEVRWRPGRSVLVMLLRKQLLVVSPSGRFALNITCNTTTLPTDFKTLVQHFKMCHA